jgi:low affinity Fe/Cu permease
MSQRSLHDLSALRDDHLRLSEHHSRIKGQWFHRFACECGRLAGKPSAFILASALVVIWLITGPIFGYSDTWQLVINTATTIITFLMVFLIQHSQNRDTLALQVKLSELVIAVAGARNELAAAEDMPDDELAAMKESQRGAAQKPAPAPTTGRRSRKS